LFVLSTLSPSAAPEFGAWSPPVNLGSVVNSTANDAAPSISTRGSSLYFNSNRMGSLGQDIWVSQWDDVAQEWGAPQNLGPFVNSGFIDASPRLSRDEHWLFFHSNRGGNMDIWMSYREHVHDDFGWEPPAPVVGGVNSAAEETMGGYFENDDLGTPHLYFGSTRLGNFDLFFSELQPDGTFGPATPIPALSSPAADPGMMVSFNGLEAFLMSGRMPGGSGGQDLWTATRVAVGAPWSVPVNLGPTVNSGPTTNSAGIDQGPYLAADRTTLYFASDRSGNLDLYVTTRTGPGR
jgi:hypothetical protein